MQLLYIESTLLSGNDFWMKGAASCIRHEENLKKIWDFEYDYFPSILCINFQSGLKKNLAMKE